MLRLRVDADRAAQLPAQPLAQPQHLLEGRHLEAAVPDACSPGASSGRRSFARRVFSSASVKSVVNHPVTGRPSTQLRRSPGSELGVLGDVGRAADLGLVPGDEHAVLGRDEVGLDEVGAHPGGELVGGQGVLRSVAGGPAVADDERLPLRAGRPVARSARAGAGVGAGRGRGPATQERSWSSAAAANEARTMVMRMRLMAPKPIASTSSGGRPPEGGERSSSGQSGDGDLNPTKATRPTRTPGGPHTPCSTGWPGGPGGRGGLRGRGGYEPTMSESKSITVQRTIDASASEIFDVLSNPKRTSPSTARASSAPTRRPSASSTSATSSG